ncbi:MIEF1 upstream open reading frame protein [Thrips palmi]|uniref:MIEF1 upstream open reading frame protein n=1 Tax=Thrips palmi TaxID=161013 RepID=A0A6P9AI15_THRPL|nr:MIEF1 upstream open reading frame protein [Thrips palmi]
MKISTNQVLGLYRNLLRYGQQLKFTDQNYFKERVREEFRTNRNVTSEDKIEFFYKKGKSLLERKRIV